MKDEKDINVNNEEIFRYKLGSWVLLRDECAFMNLDKLGKGKSMHQYLIESIDNWVTKRENFKYKNLFQKCVNLLKAKMRIFTSV